MLSFWTRKRTRSCSIQSRGPVEPWASWWQLRFGLFPLGSGWSCATGPYGVWMPSARCLQRSLLTKRTTLWRGCSIAWTRLLLWPALWLTTLSLTRWDHVHAWPAYILCLVDLFMGFFIYGRGLFKRVRTWVTQLWEEERTAACQNLHSKLVREALSAWKHIW